MLATLNSMHEVKVIIRVSAEQLVCANEMNAHKVSWSLSQSEFIHMQLGVIT